MRHTGGMTTYRVSLRLSPADVLDNACEDFARLCGPHLPRRELLRAALWTTANALDVHAPAVSQQEAVDACATLMVAWLTDAGRIDDSDRPAWGRLAAAMTDHSVSDVRRWMLDTANMIRNHQAMADGDVAEVAGITWPAHHPAARPPVTRRTVIVPARTPR